MSGYGFMFDQNLLSDDGARDEIFAAPRQAAVGFSTFCVVDPRSNRLLEKTEKDDSGETSYKYDFDDKGHLTGVRINGRVMERYQYDRKGRRSKSVHGLSERIVEIVGGGKRKRIPVADNVRAYAYDERGQLIGAGSESFEYDNEGNLRQRVSSEGVTTYEYHKTLLACVKLPGKALVSYLYDADSSNPLGPAVKLKNGIPAAE